MSNLELREAYLQSLDSFHLCCKTWSSIWFPNHYNLIITIKFLQFVPKLWHVEYCIIFSIVHLNASISECNVVCLQITFLVPKSCAVPMLSNHTHPHPLNCAEDVQDQSIMQILSTLKTWDVAIPDFCGTSGIIAFALNQI